MIMTRKIIEVDKDSRLVQLHCGHTKKWPEMYLSTDRQIKKNPLPKVGQITECQSCRDGVKMILRKKFNAEWSF